MSHERSDWERSIEQYVRHTYPYLFVQSSNRSIIPSRERTGEFLEIDIYIPELRLGIEANGEYWHDRARYERDKRQGTEYSVEMYKENYCLRNGITLVHVWDSEDGNTIQGRINIAIRSKPRTESYASTNTNKPKPAKDPVDSALDVVGVCWIVFVIVISIAGMIKIMMSVI